MKKTYSIIQKITIFIIILASLLMIFGLIFSNNKNGIFGYRGFIVLSDSMSVTDFDAGDLIVIKKIDFINLKEGDIISYISQSSDNYMEIITHKIRKITTNELGEVGFITYGTTTGVDDEEIVTYPYILGKYIFRIPKIGVVLQFIKTIPGYIIFVGVPFLILITTQLINAINNFKSYKKNQINELREEREQIEIERKEIEKKIEELRALEEKVKKNNSKSKKKKKKV